MALPEEFEPVPNLSQHPPTTSTDDPFSRAPCQNQTLARRSQCSRRGRPSDLPSLSRPTYARRRSRTPALPPPSIPFAADRRSARAEHGGASEQKHTGRGGSALRDASSEPRV